MPLPCPPSSRTPRALLAIDAAAALFACATVAVYVHQFLSWDAWALSLGLLVLVSAPYALLAVATRFAPDRLSLWSCALVTVGCAAWGSFAYASAFVPETILTAYGLVYTRVPGVQAPFVALAGALVGGRRIAMRRRRPTR